LTSRQLTRRTLIALGCLFISVMACAGTPSPPSQQRSGVEFLEQNAAVARVDAAPTPHTDGTIVTEAVAGISSSVTVTAVSFDTDAGLRAQYLGWSDCHSGCAGTAAADAGGLALARNSVGGTLPVKLPHEFDPNATKLSFVIVLRVDGATGLAALQHRCLHVVDARLTLADGSVVVARTPDHRWIAAMMLLDQGPGYGRC
jgi:hypothetical protein